KLVSEDISMLTVEQIKLIMQISKNPDINLIHAYQIFKSVPSKMIPIFFELRKLLNNTIDAEKCVKEFSQEQIDMVIKLAKQIPNVYNFVKNISLEKYEIYKKLINKKISHIDAYTIIISIPTEKILMFDKLFTILGD